MCSCGTTVSLAHDLRPLIYNQCHCKDKECTECTEYMYVQRGKHTHTEYTYKLPLYLIMSHLSLLPLQTCFVFNTSPSPGFSYTHCRMVVLILWCLFSRYSQYIFLLLHILVSSDSVSPLCRFFLVCLTASLLPTTD